MAAVAAVKAVALVLSPAKSGRLFIACTEVMTGTGTPKKGRVPGVRGLWGAAARVVVVCGGPTGLDAPWEWGMATRIGCNAGTGGGGGFWALLVVVVVVVVPVVVAVGVVVLLVVVAVVLEGPIPMVYSFPMDI